MNWILHIRQFLVEINASLEIRNLWLPKHQCHHDQFIMEAFEKTKANTAELRILNNWRLYYKVILFSELCYSSGTGIQAIYLDYTHSLSLSQTKSNLHWPVQGKPNEISFKIWKRYVKLCFMNSENKRSPHLGKWDISEVIKTSPRCGCYDKTNSNIYIPTATNNYIKYKAFNISRTSARYDPSTLGEIESLLPGEVVPIDMHEYPESVLVKFALPLENQILIQPQQESKWQQEILTNLIIEDETELRQKLEDPLSTVHIVSDGGVHNYQSNFGLVIANKSYSLATNMGKIYSVPFHESSYRSEMFGMLAEVVSLKHILETFNFTLPAKKKLYFYCDNKSALRTIKSRLEHYVGP
jgi:hypothetical protein